MSLASARGVLSCWGADSLDSSTAFAVGGEGAGSAGGESAGVAAARAADLVDYAAVASLKLPALTALFDVYYNKYLNTCTHGTAVLYYLYSW